VEVYREVEEFGGNEQEHCSFEDIMAHSLDFRGNVRDVDWWIGDIHLGDRVPASTFPNAQIITEFPNQYLRSPDCTEARRDTVGLLEDVLIAQFSAQYC
jgi:hypothetical protein